MVIHTVVISTVIANILTCDRCVLSAVPILFAVQKSAQKICNAARGEGGEVKIRVEEGGSDWATPAATCVQKQRNLCALDKC